MREEIMQGIKTLMSLSATMQEIPPKELLVGASGLFSPLECLYHPISSPCWPGILYLSAEQRRALRDAPDGFQRLIASHPQTCPVPPQLLEALLGMALLGAKAPYHETPCEAQRYGLQHGWRLVTERLAESRKHRPAWALFVSRERRTCAVAVRGTDVEQSRGGDLFTDFDACAVPLVGGAACHRGVAAAARALQRELRQALRALHEAGYRLILTGHSLGGAVAAVLLYLLQKEEGLSCMGLGYAVPSVLDLETSQALQGCFTSVVNSMDAVLRLTPGALKRLAEELRSTAEQSGKDLDEDLQHYVDRLSTVWAPRVRDGLPEAPVWQEVEEEQELWAQQKEEEVDLRLGVSWDFRQFLMGFPSFSMDIKMQVVFPWFSMVFHGFRGVSGIFAMGAEVHSGQRGVAPPRAGPPRGGHSALHAATTAAHHPRQEERRPTALQRPL